MSLGCVGAAGQGRESSASGHMSSANYSKHSISLCHLNAFLAPPLGDTSWPRPLALYAVAWGTQGCFKTQWSLTLALEDQSSSWSQRTVSPSNTDHHGNQTARLPVTKSFTPHNVKIPSRLNLGQMFAFLLMAHLFRPL